jgi:monoamine oxidase
MQKSRRDFIRKLAAGSALVSLGGCSSVDRFFMGESRDESDKVLILGAGLAGLSAGYLLKKNQIPFRMFEASGRFGGRVMTLRDFNISSRQAELAGDRVDVDHLALQSLAQELKISMDEVTTKDSAAWFEKGKFLNAKEWRTELADLQKLFRNLNVEAYGNQSQYLNFKNKDQFPRAVYLDQMSAQELMSRLETQFRPWMRPFLEQVTRSEWGAEPSAVSALHLLHWVRDSFKPQSKKYLKITGGSSVLTQALYDRVGGVIPDRLVKFNHRLVEIERNENG